ncbi:MAG: FIST C-terminal domain-containing protein [Actinomycetota bacterium]|jgi:small ligand-binding sensory domain FIST|nr:FIST C-terminal domain-containing protein [Actinomycetota bacterium]
MPFAAALSEHPLATQATGEVVGSLLEGAGTHPDVVMLFVSRCHAGALQDISSAVASVLKPIAVIGCAAESVIGPHREVEQAPGIAALSGTVGPLVPVVLTATTDGADIAVEGWPHHVAFEPQTLLLFTDPFTFAAGSFLDWLAVWHPGITVVGGMASGARGAGGTRLVSGTTVVDRGAVGVLLGPSASVSGAVSQGCRPFGRSFVVTGASGNVITELSGRPPLERLVQQATACLSAEEADCLGDGGLQVGRVVDEHHDEPGRSTVLVRPVLGADRGSGAIAVGDEIPVGATVQFHLRDAAAADVDLQATLAGHRAEAALVFSCTARGTRLFPARDHDVTAITDALGPVPVAGFFADGEIGPVGGRNFVHGSTAAIALLHEGPGAAADGETG